MPGNITTCRSCGARIRWIRTPAGKSMPCDERPISYLPNPQGKAKLVTPEGTVVSCDEVQEGTEGSLAGYRAHWSTCDNPNRFKRRTRA